MICQDTEIVIVVLYTNVHGRKKVRYQIIIMYHVREKCIMIDQVTNQDVSFSCKIDDKFNKKYICIECAHL